MKITDNIHLIYGSDNNYVIPTMVSAASAAFGIRNDYVLNIHLLDLGITDENYIDFEERILKVNPLVRCIRHILDKTLFSGFGAWQGSVATYARMFAADILSGIDWAIYVDGDTLWLGDIAELWDLKDDKFLALASIDPPTPDGSVSPGYHWYKENGLVVDKEGYFCAGLMLMNLKKMREDKLPEQCREFMKKYPAPHLVDQTVLNYVLQGKSKLLPPQWGVFSVWHGGVNLSQSALIHYVGDLPWRRDKINRLLSDIVILWYYFCQDVLETDMLPRYMSSFARFWRRQMFLLLQKNPWLLFNAVVRSRFRNTHGISDKTVQMIRERWRQD